MSSNTLNTTNIENNSLPSQEISIEPTEVSQNIPNLDPNPVPQASPEVIEAITGCQQGNFLPALHCLRYNLMPKDFVDQTGYNILHYAVRQNSIPTVLTLLNDFEFDINFRSTNNQTPLMIACNYGYTEIICILIDKGAQINEIDETGFNALLYSVKKGSIPQVAYLLHHEADTTIRDANGCTIVHWAAYKKNVFLLEVLKRLGFDLNCKDATDLTPLDRAVQSEASLAVKYLLENGDGNMPVNMDYDQVTNMECKELLRKQYFPTKFEKLQTEFKKEYWSIFIKHSRKITFGVYAFLWLFMMRIYMKAAMNNDIFDVIFFLMGIIFIGYSFWYFLISAKLKGFGYQKLDRTSDYLDDTTNSRNAISRFESDPLDKLIKGDSSGIVIQEVGSEEPTSFLHELAWNFETKNYEAITKFNEKKYCPKCLQKKPERSHHPENSTTCVPYFHHYSYTLGGSVDRNNHHLYLLLLINQAIIFQIFSCSLEDAYSGKLEPNSFALVEMGSKLFEDFGLIYSFIYMVLLTLAGFNFVFLCIEFLGVMKNLTYHEMFNANSCPYLWEIKRDSHGQMMIEFSNKYDIGMYSNIKDYFKYMRNN